MFASGEGLRRVNRDRFKTARPVARLREGRADWYRIEAKSSAKASIYIYDEIGYVGITAQDFVRDLQAVKAPEIELHIDSPGGDVFDAVSIYNAVRDHPAVVTTVVDSLAASAASFIAQAGDKRVMNRNSTMMIHDGHGMAIGNASDMSAMVDMLDRVSDNIASIYALHAGGTAEGWRELMRAETWYTGEEAVEAGLADEVVSMAEPKNTSQNSFDLSIFSYAGRDEAPAPTMSEPQQVPDPFEGVGEELLNAFKGAFA